MIRFSRDHSNDLCVRLSTYINGKIHTKNDTIDVAGSGGTADHAEKFARLGISFAVEMGK